MSVCPWTPDDIPAYPAPGDPAARVYAAALAMEGRSRRVNSAVAAEALYNHYGQVFVERGSVLGRRDAEERMPGCYALHEAMRDVTCDC